jgi:hypothetical protein
LTVDTQVLDAAPAYPVAVRVPAATEGRNRLTAAFRFFLAIPHLLLVGGPIAVLVSIAWTTEHGVRLGTNLGYGSGGVLGLVAGVAAFLAWWALVVAGRHPGRLWRIAAYYLRWRVRAVAYLTLLRDEYPPFGDGEYPAQLALERPPLERNRLAVALRLVLALPHILALWFLSLAWALATGLAWVAILFTGRYPETLYGFALGVFAWSVRVEAYLLLLRDEYPPFSLRA